MSREAGLALIGFLWVQTTVEVLVIVCSSIMFKIYLDMNCMMLILI